MPESRLYDHGLRRYQASIDEGEPVAKPEEIDDLVEAIILCANEEPYLEAKVLIADRLRKHITPYITEIVDLKEHVKNLNHDLEGEIKDGYRRRGF